MASVWSMIRFWSRCISPASVLLAIVIVACVDEFPSAPTLTVTIQQATSWPETIATTDTVTLEVTMVSPDGTVFTGLQVDWRSSDDDILKVSKLTPPDSIAAPDGSFRAASREDSLVAQFSATVTAHETGSAELTVQVIQLGFEPAELRVPIRVVLLTIEERIALPDTMAVSDMVIVELAIKNAEGATVFGRQIEWRSTDDEILMVTKLDSVRAKVTAVARGSADVFAIVGEEGFEPTEFRQSIRVLERWIQISAGSAHSCAVTIDNDAYCWGSGLSGALGNGRPVNSGKPTKVIGIGALNFLSVSAGDENTCGIILERVVYCWGEGSRGRLGNDDPSEASQFSPVPVSGGNIFQSLTAGQTTCAVADDFSAFCWGDNSFGQLGVVPEPFSPLDTCIGNVPCSRTPRQVSSSATSPLDPFISSAVDVGGFHTCAISRSPAMGLAFCWGTGFTGALGNGPTTFSQTPIAVSGGLSFLSISAGQEHTCGVTTTGAAYCWGLGLFGRLGNGSTSQSTTPVTVSGGLTFQSVSAGGQHTCGVTTTGAAYCWGRGAEGQLGNGSMSDSTTPVAVSGGLTFQSVSAGGQHTCGIVATSGAAYCWGQGAQGQLGNGLADDSLRPGRVSEPD